MRVLVLAGVIQGCLLSLRPFNIYVGDWIQKENENKGFRYKPNVRDLRQSLVTSLFANDKFLGGKIG